MEDETTDGATQYNVGVDPKNGEAQKLAEQRAVGTVSRLEFDGIRTVITGTYEQSDVEFLRKQQGVAYVEVDETAQAHDQ